MKIRVKVTSNARSEEVIKNENDYLVRVKEPAREGKANKAMIKALAGYFKVTQSSVRILSGVGGRNKIVEITE
jgi:uncharacterized protein (TIGR00251 family)